MISGNSEVWIDLSYVEDTWKRTDCSTMFSHLDLLHQLQIHTELLPQDTEIKTGTVGLRRLNFNYDQNENINAHGEHSGIF